MKKSIILIVFILSTLSLLAQEKIVYYSNGVAVYEKVISEIDSVTFSNGTSTSFETSTTFQYPVVGIDSIVFVNNSGQGDTEGDIYIIYHNGSAVEIINPYSSRGVTITASGENVTVFAASGLQDINYHIQGTAVDGSLTIASDYRLNMFLEDANITSNTGAAINITSDKKVTVTLVDGTTNTLVDCSLNGAKAAFCSEGHVVFIGNGTLNITGNKKHGINSDGHITMLSGNINVLNAVSDGIHANYFVMNSGSVNINASGDGIDANYGSEANATRGYIDLLGGSVNITAATADTKGLKADSTIYILNADVTITASGDQTKAMKADQFIKIDGGSVNITASGATVVTLGDPSYCSGIKSPSVYINGGEITVNCTSTNDGGKCISVDNLLRITGGITTLTTAGTGATYTNTSNQSDSYVATCIKSDTNIEIVGGSLDMTCSGAGAKGISCDGNLSVSDGTIVVKATGTDAKGIKVDTDANISGGTFTLTCSGQESKGISCDNNLNISGGNFTVTLSGKASKAFKSDVATTFANASVNANVSGATLVSGTSASNSVVFKSNGTITINSGTISVTTTSASGGAKAIAADGNININGGNITINTAGAGATLSGSGTSCTDGYASCGIKSDANIDIQGGVISITTTGKGGKGISADGTITIGTVGADDELIDIDIQTSGAPVNASSGGGMPGPGGSSSSYWKGIAKGIKAYGNVYLNSGHVTVNCTQTSGDPTAEAIESKAQMYIRGGYIETDAYDDCINAATYLEISGGYVYANGRGNDAIDCNGTNINITGGVIVAIVKSEQAIDVDLGESQGHTITISGGIILAKGGNMGVWSNGGMGGPGGGGSSTSSPTFSNGQKYLSPSFTNGKKYYIKNSASNTIMIYECNETTTSSGGGGWNPGGSSSSSWAFTCPEVTSGTYTLYTGATISGGTFNWHGLYFGATATGGTSSSLTAQ